MNKISVLRTFVNNGWTITNRKNIISKLGKSNFECLINSIRNSGINYNQLKYDFFESHLTPKFDITWIGNEMIKIEDLTNINAFKNLLSKIKETNTIIESLPKGVNWNSDKYLMFRLLDQTFACQDSNLKILMGSDSKIHTKLKDLLFENCKRLGRTETHYRIEGFDFDPINKNNNILRELFEQIESLKVGDTYRPKTFLWTTNKKSATMGYGGWNPNKIVQYEIIYQPESKIIEYPIKILGEYATEAVAPRNSKFKILEKINEGNNIYIKMQLL